MTDKDPASLSHHIPVDEDHRHDLGDGRDDAGDGGVGDGDFVFAYAAWAIALAAMLGSLFFGEVMKLPPCTLCWYQRICLFPLPVVLAVGILRRDRRLGAYALPLVVAGLGVAVYHNLLYWGVIPEGLSPCTEALSCKTRHVEWLGFITIPLMSLGTFVAVLVCLLAHRARQSKGPRNKVRA
jgi:disulfide bond formation protein DsbB